MTAADDEGRANVILLCPSCHTRYRHGPVESAPPATAQCSRCDETFPYVEAKRTYVLIPPMPRPAGMDDPSLAPRIRAGATGGDRVSAQLTPRLAELVDQAAAGRAGVAEPELLSTPSGDLAAAGESAGSAREQRPGVGTRLLELFLAVVPPCGAAAVAYRAAVQNGGDSLSWAALGAAAGLVLGWAGLLWARSRR